MKDRPDVPLVEVLMQDGTPLRTCSMHVRGSGNLSVNRRAREGHEWLVPRVFLMDMLDKKVALFTELLDMLDKTAATHHAAGVDLWPGARVLGHTGLLISHGVWDRAIQSACEK